MDSGIVWLVILLAVEAGVFVLTLYLARAFTRSHDQEWLEHDDALRAASSPTVRAARIPVLRLQRAEG